MLILTAILILFVLPLLILSLNRLHPRPGYQWLLALGGALAAWVLVLFSRLQLPRIIPLIEWKPETLFSTSPALLLDEYSWPYAVAVVTIPVAIFLTNIARGREIKPGAWAASLAMAGSGLLAVLAANPLTLLLAWAIIDLAETVTLLRQVTGSDQREQVVMATSVRVAGMLMLLVAMTKAQILGMTLTFSDIPPEVSGYLLLAAGLRLGVLPPHKPFLEEQPLRRGLGTMARLMPAAATLVLLTRVATVGAPQNWEPYLLAGAALAALYSSMAWVIAKDELDGRPFWILGVAALSFAAAVRVQPAASTAWGLSLLFSGSLLFLFSTRNRPLLALPILGLLGFLALPFSPTWSGLVLHSGLGVFFRLIFILAHALLILGYIRHAIQVDSDQDAVERWVWVIYPVGLAILPLTHFGVVWLSGGMTRPEAAITSIAWWGGAVTLGLAAALMALFRRNLVPSDRVASVLRDVFSLTWFYRSFWWLYRSLSTVIANIALILEGEGGILWAVLILSLLVTLIIQQGGGG
ncbi:MAG: hypothetical protein ABIG63_10315 [Chloroflexota bacterium]